MSIPRERDDALPVPVNRIAPYYLLKILLENELAIGFFALLIFLLLFLTSCAPNTRSGDLLSKYASPPGKSGTLNAELVQKGAELNKAYSVSDYKVGPEDLLEIDVFQVSDLKSTVRVSAQGFIKVPLLDRIDVSGMTVSELENLLAEKLKKYLQEPVVSVFVKEYRSQQISVLGSVKDPHIYYATGQKSLLDMLSLAGGLAPDAGSVCIIQRTTRSVDDKGNDKEDVEKIVIDLDELLINGRAELNTPVYSGDVILVPKSGIFFVDGGVNSPGEYQLKGKTTFSQAISMAKGLGYVAQKDDIRIYRDTGKPQREVITVSYEAVMAGTSPDIEIKDKDIILVSKNGFKTFLSGISGALNFGAFTLGKGF